MVKRLLNLFVPTKAPSNRPRRVEKEIQRLLSEIFQRQELPPIWDQQKQIMPFPGPLTVTNVKISKDLRECRVYVMPLANRHADTVIPYFESAAPVLRKVFAERSTLRLVPHFRVELDDSFATAERIETLLKALADGTPNERERSS